MKFGDFHVFLVLCTSALGALPGCNSARSVGPCVPVEGKVTLGDKPLAGGMVSFLPLEAEDGVPRSEGVVDAQGRYALKTAGREGRRPESIG